MVEEARLEAVAFGLALVRPLRDEALTGQARRGELLDVLALPGFIAKRDGRTIGLATYRLENDECELAFITTLERDEPDPIALRYRARQSA
jgi:hypothetical protein